MLARVVQLKPSKAIMGEFRVVDAFCPPMTNICNPYETARAARRTSGRLEVLYTTQFGEDGSGVLSKLRLELPPPTIMSVLKTTQKWPVLPATSLVGMLHAVPFRARTSLFGLPFSSTPPMNVHNIVENDSLMSGAALGHKVNVECAPIEGPEGRQYPRAARAAKDEHEGAVHESAEVLPRGEQHRDRVPLPVVGVSLDRLEELGPVGASEDMDRVQVYNCDMSTARGAERCGDPRRGKA